MTEIRQGLGREELAGLVCATLERHGAKVVLSGGAVVSIYAGDEYVSYDLDFVLTGLARRVDAAMRELGFEKEGRHWRHPATRFWIEFPPGPVAVGDSVVTEFAERATGFGTLRLLGPTECVMDRLSGYFHWNDLQCLEQAVAVAERHPIDIDRIARWARAERAGAKWEAFLEQVSGGL